MAKHQHLKSAVTSQWSPQFLSTVFLHRAWISSSFYVKWTETLSQTNLTRWFCCFCKPVLRRHLPPTCWSSASCSASHLLISESVCEAFTFNACSNYLLLGKIHYISRPSWSAVKVNTAPPCCCCSPSVSAAKRWRAGLYVACFTRLSGFASSCCSRQTIKTTKHVLL